MHSSFHTDWQINNGFLTRRSLQAPNQDFLWGGANEAKANPTTEMYFLSSDPFI